MSDNTCAVCKKVAHMKCSLCGLVWYCSPTCQKAHWAEHKPNCNQQAIEANSDEKRKESFCTSLNACATAYNAGEDDALVEVLRLTLDRMGKSNTRTALMKFGYKSMEDFAEIARLGKEA